MVANRLLIGKPQQQTLARWPSIGDRIQRYIDARRIVIQRLDDLLPFEQEVMCSEFLRMASTKNHKLPQLAFLNAPIGRSREAVDITGVTKNGTMILAQVTHHERSSSELATKAKAL